jgi:hypothetical protein
MKFGKIAAAAGLSLALGAFAPPVFAQAGGGGGGGSAATGGGMPATSGSGQSVTNGSPSEGQPGTQAPSSAAPLGNASSDYMSSEGPNAAANSAPSGQSATNSETQLRRTEVGIERDITTARHNGLNVPKAEHQKWLGSMALAKGDRVSAMRHFDRAKRDLATQGGNAGATSQNESRSNLHANETSQPANAANMHSNNGASSAY